MRAERAGGHWFCSASVPTSGRRNRPRAFCPLSLISSWRSSEGRKSVKGGRFCRRSEPLTDFLPSVQSASRERGPGSQGACPLAEYEAAPHARPSAPSPSPDSVLCWIGSGFSRTLVCPTVSRARFATLPSALCCGCRHGALWCSKYRGAAISEAICGVPVAWFPTISRDLAVTPTRRFRLSRRFRSVLTSQSAVRLSL
jgi:hypothetical protein